MPKRKFDELTIQHSSMEVFDSKKQQRADAIKVMGTGNDVICGTEANPLNWNLRRALRREARRKGYFIHFGGRSDSWLAIRKDTCHNRLRPQFGYVKFFDGARRAGDPNGPYGERGLAYGVFRHPTLGTVAVGTTHYLTKGRTKSQTPRGRFNHYDMNTGITRAIGGWAKTFGAKASIAFVTADTNIPDRTNDVFRGEPLTTCWDELGKYVDSGHGSIDIIASYDKDRRVRCDSARMRSDLRLNSDHKTVEATYKVRKLT